jgi:uncharacterized membrane protein YadS
MNLRRPEAAVFLLLALACLHPAVSSAAGLVLGLAFAAFLSHPWPERNRVWIHRFLTVSIVGIGAGMNLLVLARVGMAGIGYTFAGIVLTLAIGLGLGRALGTPTDLSILLSSGTAICGGSAIAAVSAVLRSKPAEVSAVLVVVFLLNSVALLAFPPIGHRIGLDETSFGLWSALAIHDTSSVVGAGLRYGPRALEVGTTVKLARALWIVPLALAIGAARRGSEPDGRRAPFRKPWFILGFVVAAALVTWIPALAGPGHVVAEVAKRLFVVTLFLIGSGFDRKSLGALSARPFVQAAALWAIISVATLIAVTRGWITAGF